MKWLYEDMVLTQSTGRKKLHDLLENFLCNSSSLQNLTVISKKEVLLSFAFTCLEEC